MAGEIIAPSVQVTAQDASGNTVTGFTGFVTRRSLGGGRRLRGHECHRAAETETTTLLAHEHECTVATRYLVPPTFLS